jgi:hypothetical protein
VELEPAYQTKKFEGRFPNPVVRCSFFSWTGRILNREAGFLI